VQAAMHAAAGGLRPERREEQRARAAAAGHALRALRRKTPSVARATHPLACRSFRMDSASTAMQATISCVMIWPLLFQTSHRLSPSMSITMM